MSMFTLAISWLTTSNLPWFTDLTFQVPMQYCPWQLWILLSPPDTSTIGHHFCFGSASSFLLELFFCFSPVAFWTSSDLGEGDSSSSVISFCLFILFMELSRQECWSGWPFPSPVNGPYVYPWLHTTCSPCVGTTVGAKEDNEGGVM